VAVVMADASGTVEPLRAYFDQLPVETRTRLLAELELAQLRNDDMPELTETVIEELTRGLRKSGAKLERVGNPSRLFFTPVEPFLVDGAPSAIRRAEIARGSLGPIWAWLCRDVAPQKAKRYSELATRALLGRDLAGAKGLAHAFQGNAVKDFERTIFTSGADTVRDRLAAFMGPPRAFNDLLELIHVFSVRGLLALLASELPAKITDLRGSELDRAAAALGRLEQADRSAVLYGLVLLMQRLAMPWQLVRLALRSSQGGIVTDITQAPFAMGVGLVLRACEDMVARTCEQFREGDDGAASESLTRLAAAIEGVTELPTPLHGAWGKRFAALRTQVEKLKELEHNVWSGGHLAAALQAAGRVRR
jgi:hypothetical protein